VQLDYDTLPSNSGCTLSLCEVNLMLLNPAVNQQTGGPVYVRR